MHRRALARRAGALLLSSNAAMRLRLSDPALTPELIEFLQSRLDVVTDRVAADEVEVSLVGSYAPNATRMMLLMLIRPWEAAKQGLAVPCLLAGGTFRSCR